MYDTTIATPKTESSIRKINLPNEVIKVLREWRLRCPHSELNLVFPNESGNFLNRQNLRKRQLIPLLRKTGVTDITFHGLRHTFATMLLTNDVNPKYIQNQLGHASIKITMDTYSHVLPEIHQKGIEAVNRIIEQPKTDNRRFGT